VIGPSYRRRALVDWIVEPGPQARAYMILRRGRNRQGADETARSGTLVAEVAVVVSNRAAAEARPG